MTHLPFIAGAYGLFVVLAAAYAVGAWRRLATARRKLAALEPRGRADA